jgi:hypothetical protein
LPEPVCDIEHDYLAETAARRVALLCGSDPGADLDGPFILGGGCRLSPSGRLARVAYHAGMGRGVDALGPGSHRAQHPAWCPERAADSGQIHVNVTYLENGTSVHDICSICRTHHGLRRPE